MEARGPISDDARWSFALESAGLGVWDADLVAGTCYYSPVWKRMIGYADHEIGNDGEAWLDFVHPDDRERALASGGAHIEGRTPMIETEFRLRHKDGYYIWVLDRGRVVARDADGQPTRMMGVQTDISSQKETERELSLLNARIRLAVEAGGIGLWHRDMDAAVLHWDGRMHELYGTDPSTFRGTAADWIERLHPEDAMRAQREIDEAAAVSKPVGSTFRVVRPDGEVRHIRCLARVVRRPGLPQMLVGTDWDVTEQVLAAQALAEEKERLRITLQSIGDAVISTDTEDRVSFMNRAAEQLTLFTLIEAQGAPLHSVLRPVHEETGLPLPSPTLAAMTERRSIEQEGPGMLIRRDISRRSIRSLASPVIATTGETLGAVLVVQDTTAARALQRELAHAANHDMLTGLKSRAAFEGILSAAIAQATAEGARHALLYVDLDRFKIINDTAGHAAGDGILKNVAAALRACVEARDTVARLGGDEFAVLLRDRSVEEAEGIAEAIVERISGERFPWAGKVHEIGASIGLAIIDRNGQGAETVLAQADVACYAAKASGRNRVSTFRSDAGAAKQHMAELQVASGIRQAIAQNRFRLYGQEIRDLQRPLKRGGKLEILTRMIAPDGSMVPPGAFIPAAERFDLMGALDRWVVETALGEFGGLIMAAPDLDVAINLSANSLSDPGLWPFVREQLRQSGFDAGRLTFEITETAVINNYAAAERFVAEARQAGCRISLDDFGSGVSSFAYLKRFPVDAIKIDGAFVEHMHVSRYDHAIVRLISEIAREIGVDVIAERVERTEQVEILQALQVGYGQGFLFHRPWPLRSVLESYGAVEPAPASRRAS